MIVYTLGLVLLVFAFIGWAWLISFMISGGTLGVQVRWLLISVCSSQFGLMVFAGFCLLDHAWGI